MSALVLMGRARSAGLALVLDGERLVIRGPQRAEALAQALLARKADVVLALQLEAAMGRAVDGSEAPERDEWIERFEERAAIMEFDGGLPRDEADRLAMAATIEAVAASRGGTRG